MTRPRAGARTRPALVVAVTLLAGTLAACSGTSNVLVQATPTSPPVATATPAPPTAGTGGATLTVAPSGNAGTAPSATAAPPTSVSPSAGTATPAVPATTATAPTGYVAPPLAWASCEGPGMQCAELTVPVDYAKPKGATIRLALIRTQATGMRIGSLLVNPGGPGASGYDFVRDGVDTFSATLRSRFDIVGFDPRGVSRSAGVRCTTDAQLDAFLHDDPYPDSQAHRDAYTAASKAYAAGCTTSAATAALLPHIGTVEAAKDLDVMRAALGDAKLSYFGYSYGTYLGATYAQLFPKNVRALYLDGPVDPDLDLVGFVQGQAKAFEVALGRWFTWCTMANGCAFAGTGGQTVQERFDAVQSAIGANPLAVGSRSLGLGEFSYGVDYTMYSRSFWPQLSQALLAAEDGDGSALLALSDSYTQRSSTGSYSNATDANYAVNCLDHGGPRTEQGWDSAATAIQAAAPRLGEPIVYNTLPCAYWPVPARATLKITGAGAPPILVTGTTFDPATPYSWAQALSKDLVSSVLLTRNGDGHTAYGPQAPCVEAIADRYLTTLVMPAAGTAC